MKFLDSDLLRTWDEDWDARIGIAVVTGFLWMLVSAVIDMSTSCPTWVWVSLWIGVPCFMIIFPSIRWISPNNWLPSGVVRNAVKDYQSLPAVEQKSIPQTALHVLRDSTLSLESREQVGREVIRLVHDIDASRMARDADSVRDIVKELELRQESVREYTRTYKELE